MSELPACTNRKTSDDTNKGDIKMEAAIFFESYLPDALRLALEYAGDDGFVASMPALLHARANAPYHNIIWNTWFTSNSEESVAMTPQGQRVVVTVHGGGIFASPERFEKLYHASVARSCEIGFTGLFTAKITATEATEALQGKLPDGTVIPVFSFEEFKRGVKDLPRRHAVVMDYEMAKKSKNGYETFDDLKDDPLMIVRAGGVEAAATYLDQASDRYNTTVMGSWHPYHDINPDQFQTSITILSGNIGGVDADKDDDHIRGIDAEFGLRSGISMVKVARYVAVAPRDAFTTVRDLRFS